jgi:hypothetical protein
VSTSAGKIGFVRQRRGEPIRGQAHGRISPSMAVALLALVVAMAGTAYANGLIGGADVRDGSLTGRDVKDDSIRSRDVSGLTAADFRAGALPAASDSPPGPAGAPGAAGSLGPPGPPGPLLDTLPSGRTLRGIYSASGSGGVQLSISYQFPLAQNSTNVAFLAPSDPRPAGCPTTGGDEVAEASPGWLCVYQTNEDSNNNIDSKFLSWSRFGFIASAGPDQVVPNVFLEGRWAVTAP